MRNAPQTSQQRRRSVSFTDPSRDQVRRMKMRSSTKPSILEELNVERVGKRIQVMLDEQVSVQEIRVTTEDAEGETRRDKYEISASTLALGYGKMSAEKQDALKGSERARILATRTIKEMMKICYYGNIQRQERLIARVGQIERNLDAHSVEKPSMILDAIHDEFTHLQHHRENHIKQKILNDRLSVPCHPTSTRLLDDVISYCIRIEELVGAFFTAKYTDANEREHALRPGSDGHREYVRAILRQITMAVAQPGALLGEAIALQNIATEHAGDLTAADALTLLTLLKERANARIGQMALTSGETLGINPMIHHNPHTQILRGRTGRTGPSSGRPSRNGADGRTQFARNGAFTMQRSNGQIDPTPGRKIRTPQANTYPPHRKNDSESRECWNCGLTGHLSHQCPNRRHGVAAKKKGGHARRGTTHPEGSTPWGSSTVTGFGQTQGSSTTTSRTKQNPAKTKKRQPRVSESKGLSNQLNAYWTEQSRPPARRRNKTHSAFAIGCLVGEPGEHTSEENTEEHRSAGGTGQPDDQLPPDGEEAEGADDNLTRNGVRCNHADHDCPLHGPNDGLPAPTAFFDFLSKDAFGYNNRRCPVGKDGERQGGAGRWRAALHFIRKLGNGTVSEHDFELLADIAQGFAEGEQGRLSKYPSTFNETVHSLKTACGWDLESNLHVEALYGKSADELDAPIGGLVVIHTACLLVLNEHHSECAKHGPHRSDSETGVTSNPILLAKKIFQALCHIDLHPDCIAPDSSLFFLLTIFRVTFGGGPASRGGFLDICGPWLGQKGGVRMHSCLRDDIDRVCDLCVTTTGYVTKAEKDLYHESIVELYGLEVGNEMTGNLEEFLKNRPAALLRGIETCDGFTTYAGRVTAMLRMKGYPETEAQFKGIASLEEGWKAVREVIEPILGKNCELGDPPPVGIEERAQSVDGQARSDSLDYFEKCVTYLHKAVVPRLAASRINIRNRLLEEGMTVQCSIGETRSPGPPLPPDLPEAVEYAKSMARRDANGRDAVHISGTTHTSRKCMQADNGVSMRIVHQLGCAECQRKAVLYDMAGQSGYVGVSSTTENQTTTARVCHHPMEGCEECGVKHSKMNEKVSGQTMISFVRGGKLSLPETMASAGQFLAGGEDADRIVGRAYGRSHKKVKERFVEFACATLREQQVTDQGQSAGNEEVWVALKRGNLPYFRNQITPGGKINVTIESDYPKQVEATEGASLGLVTGLFASARMTSHKVEPTKGFYNILKAILQAPLLSEIKLKLDAAFNRTIGTEIVTRNKEEDDIVNEHWRNTHREHVVALATNDVRDDTPHERAKFAKRVAKTQSEQMSMVLRPEAQLYVYSNAIGVYDHVNQRLSGPLGVVGIDERTIHMGPRSLERFTLPATIASRPGPRNQPEKLRINKTALEMTVLAEELLHQLNDPDTCVLYTIDGRRDDMGNEIVQAHLCGGHTGMRFNPSHILDDDEGAYAVHNTLAYGVSNLDQVPDINATLLEIQMHSDPHVRGAAMKITFAGGNKGDDLSAALNGRPPMAASDVAGHLISRERRAVRVPGSAVDPTLRSPIGNQIRGHVGAAIAKLCAVQPHFYLNTTNLCCLGGDACPCRQSTLAKFAACRWIPATRRPGGVTNRHSTYSAKEPDPLGRAYQTIRAPAMPEYQPDWNFQPNTCLINPVESNACACQLTTVDNHLPVGVCGDDPKARHYHCAKLRDGSSAIYSCVDGHISEDKVLHGPDFVRGMLTALENDPRADPGHDHDARVYRVAESYVAEDVKREITPGLRICMMQHNQWCDPPPLTANMQPPPGWLTDDRYEGGGDVPLWDRHYRLDEEEEDENRPWANRPGDVTNPIHQEKTKDGRPDSEREKTRKTNKHRKIFKQTMLQSRDLLSPGPTSLRRPVLPLTSLPITDAIVHIDGWLKLVRDMYIDVFKRQALPVSLGVRYTLSTLFQQQLLRHNEHTRVNDLTPSQLAFGAQIIDLIDDHTAGDSTIPYPCGWIGIDDDEAWRLECKVIRLNNHGTLCNTLADPQEAKRLEEKQQSLAKHPGDPMRVIQTPLGSLTPLDWRNLDQPPIDGPTVETAQKAQTPCKVELLKKRPCTPRQIDGRLWALAPVTPPDTTYSGTQPTHDAMDTTTGSASSHSSTIPTPTDIAGGSFMTPSKLTAAESKSDGQAYMSLMTTPNDYLSDSSMDEDSHTTPTSGRVLFRDTPTLMRQPLPKELQMNGLDNACYTMTCADATKHLSILDTGASLHFSGNKDMVKHGTNTGTNSRPVKSATGSARITKEAPINLHLYPVDRQGDPEEAIILNQVIRYIPDMQEDLTLLSTGVIMRSLAKKYPEKGDGTGPELKIVEGKDRWSYIAFTDQHRVRRYIPVLKDNDIYFAKVSYSHDGHDLATNVARPILRRQNRTTGEPLYTARDAADNEEAKPRRTRPRFKGTMDVLHFAFAHCSIHTLTNTIQRSHELEATTKAITNCPSCHMTKSTLEFHDANKAKNRRSKEEKHGIHSEDEPSMTNNTVPVFEPFQEISLDPVPFPPSTYGPFKGVKWVWLMVDRSTRFMFADFTLRKDAHTAAGVITRLAQKATQLGWDLTTIKHDGEASLKEAQVNLVCDEYNIRNITCLARSPNTNRIEQMVRHIKNKLRCTLHAAQLPINEFWLPGIRDVIHKHNIVGMKAIDWKSPFELMHRHPPKLHRVRAFGSMAYVVKPHDKSKHKIGSLAPYAVPCLVLDEAPDRPGWNIWRSDGVTASATQHLIIHDLSRPRDKPPSMVCDRGLLVTLPTSNRTKGTEGLALDLPNSITGVTLSDAENVLGDWTCFQHGWVHDDAKVMHIPIGLPFCKLFTIADGSTKWYRGAVIDTYTGDNGVQQHIVQYTDGDEEDLDGDEITAGYKAWTHAIATQIPDVPHMPPFLFTKDVDNETETGEHEDISAVEPMTSMNEEQITEEADEIMSNSSDDDETQHEVTPPDEAQDTSVRRSTRERKPPVIFSPGDEGKASHGHDSDSELEDQDDPANTHALNVIFFVTDDEDPNPSASEYDGVFEIDDDNRVTHSAVRCAHNDDCAAGALLYHGDTGHSGDAAKTTGKPVAYAAGKALSYRTAMRSEHRSDYKAAADKEIDQLDDLDVLRYVTKAEMLRINKDAVPLLMGWSLVRKIDSLTGQVKSTKGRAYLRGDMSLPERDYCAHSVYSNTVSIDSVKLALGLAAAHQHKVLSFDVSGAFLNSRPSRTVFVKLPEGYRRVDANNEELYALLTRALYGSPESGARWSDDCDMTLQDQGWKRSIAEPYLYRTTAHIGGNDIYESLGDNKSNLQGETINDCIKRVRKHMDAVVTRYETREKRMAADITTEQEQLQNARKKRTTGECYHMSRSDDVQNRHLHNIPEGEAFPMLRPYDERSLCSSLPTNDEPNILWCNLLLFVDDGLVITNNEEFGRNVMEAFLRVHPGRMEVQPQSFLGLGISYHDDGAIAISQTPLIDDVTKISKMETSHDAPTPITRLVDKSEAPEDDSVAAMKANEQDFPYRTVLGKILYACHSRPEMRLATSQWARVATNPGEKHKLMIKRGVRYLKGTSKMGVTYGKHKYTNKEPFIICDANHGEGSISGIIGFSGGGAFAARSWAQKNASLYSFGSEQIALTDATKLGIWTKEVVLDMGMPLKGPLRIYDDSQALIKAATTDVSSTKTRHLRTRMAWVKDMIREGRVEVVFVGTKDNVADALTKPLPRDSFCNLRDQMLGLVPVTCRVADLAKGEEQAIKEDEDNEKTHGNNNQESCMILTMEPYSSDTQPDNEEDGTINSLFEPSQGNNYVNEPPTDENEERFIKRNETKDENELRLEEGGMLPLLNVNNRGANRRCKSI